MNKLIKFYKNFFLKKKTITNLPFNFMQFKLDEFRLEIQRRDQEILSMAAKMKTYEEQHQVSNV